LLKDILEGNVDIKRYTDEDMIIIGTPEECLEKILRYEGAGIDQLLAYQQFGMLPHDKVMRSIELLGTKIIPELEARGHRVDYSGLTGGTRP
jgi:alkanesulfonate monooxygenase SsuD/methylene tetrahydromethanopterin reductase-like flavin-dependent oxidoreductase (luciferase family)